jgi:hypothetical protein
LRETNKANRKLRADPLTRPSSTNRKEASISTAVLAVTMALWQEVKSMTCCNI